MKNNTVSAKRIKSIHPFPARMAPEIALSALNKFPKGSTVLDPMSGSGTVLRQAMLCGHNAIGYDLDPMAVMLSSVWTSKLDISAFELTANRLIKKAQSLTLRNLHLPWIDESPKTKSFISFWFGRRQISDLRKLAFALKKIENKTTTEINNALKTAFSRLIITKKRGASLAWDVSHSRPHKKIVENDFDVFSEFQKAVAHISKHLRDMPLRKSAKIRLGDARNMKELRANSIDVVLTSPPYLNAIDYMRGHKLALVWLGHSVNELTEIRARSVGAEKAAPATQNFSSCEKLLKNAVNIGEFPKRQIKMIERYALDAHQLMSEISRVLKPKGTAILVIGDSCLKGNYVKNSVIFKQCALAHKLKAVSIRKREIPMNLRYLPTPGKNTNALAKRMREEIILTFRK